MSAIPPRRTFVARRIRGGFTLVELLVVIAIISLLAGLLLPVLLRAKNQALSVACLSNLHQAGMAFSIYAEDYDGLYPYAVDPADRYTPQIWAAYPAWQSQIPFMPWLHEVLLPYVKSHEIFHCPSDSGMDIEDFTGFVLNGRPTMFAKFGTSYLYRTEIAFRHAGDATFQNPAELNVYMDGSGLWHGSGPSDLSIGAGHFFEGNSELFQRRFNTLLGDYHVKSFTFSQVWKLWHLPL
jgi:prepilin-type N-terminal cleavage/methylation domain-containing protein